MAVKAPFCSTPTCGTLTYSIAVYRALVYGPDQFKARFVALQFAVIYFLTL